VTMARSSCAPLSCAVSSESRYIRALVLIDFKGTRGRFDYDSAGYPLLASSSYPRPFRRAEKERFDLQKREKMVGQSLCRHP